MDRGSLDGSPRAWPRTALTGVRGVKGAHLVGAHPWTGDGAGPAFTSL